VPGHGIVPREVIAAMVATELPKLRLHNGHTRQQLSVTIDDSGSVTWTSVLGQSRTENPYDYRIGPDES
jgi:hypothetical protein